MGVALFEPPPFKASPDVVVFTGSAHPDEGETGQLKRCTYTREACQALFTLSNTCAKTEGNIIYNIII
jgi:hypothetical protein